MSNADWLKQGGAKLRIMWSPATVQVKVIIANNVLAMPGTILSLVHLLFVTGGVYFL